MTDESSLPRSCLCLSKFREDKWKVLTEKECAGLERVVPGTHKSVGKPAQTVVEAMDFMFPSRLLDFLVVLANREASHQRKRLQSAQANSYKEVSYPFFLSSYFTD